MATKIAPVAPYALKNVLRMTAQASFIALALVIGGFSTAGTAEAAATNYVIDLSGKGCGNNCADFQNYLAANGVVISSGSNGNTNTTVQPTTQSSSNKSISPYPYQIYTNFPSTDAYYRAMSATSTYNMPQTYPYQVYTYFQNPGPKYDPYANNAYTNPAQSAAGLSAYPMQYYVYNNGTSAATQLAKYPVAGATGSAYNYGTSGNTGFVMTSGR